jgi:hypothetical protein
LKISDGNTFGGSNPHSPPGGFMRKLYSNKMEKMLDKQEEEIIITNPNEPIKTFFRKLIYRYTVLKHNIVIFFKKPI